jgi:hypothetical protein
MKSVYLSWVELVDWRVTELVSERNAELQLL